MRSELSLDLFTFSYKLIQQTKQVQAREEDLNPVMKNVYRTLGWVKRFPTAAKEKY